MKTLLPNDTWIFALAFDHLPTRCREITRNSKNPLNKQDAWNFIDPNSLRDGWVTDITTQQLKLSRRPEGTASWHPQQVFQRQMQKSPMALRQDTA